MEFITESYRIRITEVDAHCNLTIPALNGLFQEMAWRHSVVANVSAPDLSAQHNITWVLSRMKIWIEQLPSYDETVVVKTYVQEIDKYFYYRDFKVYDSAGIEIIRANALFGLIDIARRRITSVPDWMRAITPTCGSEEPVQKVAGKILPLTSIETQRSFDIRWHDIDSNQHANNNRYVEWLMESVPTNVLNDGVLKTFEIIFKNESVFGDKVITQSQRVGEGFVHKMVNQNGLELVTGETVWTLE